MTPFLSEFLDTYIPESKRSKAKIAVQDTKLAKTLSSDLGFTCVHNDVTVELFRGIRTHFDSYVKDKSKYFRAHYLIFLDYE